jgi:hypothetical protein
MHDVTRQEIVAQHVAELHRQAAKQRLLRELRASRRQTVHRWRIWERLTIRRPRAAVMAKTAPVGPVVATVAGQQLAAPASHASPARSLGMERHRWPSTIADQHYSRPSST